MVNQIDRKIKNLDKKSKQNREKIRKARQILSQYPDNKAARKTVKENTDIIVSNNIKLGQLMGNKKRVNEKIIQYNKKYML